MKRAKFLYHCSMIDHGDELVVTRATPKQPDKDEPATPRLCVAPTIPQCFASRLFMSQVFVYRTPKPLRGVTPKGVWDSLITDERWLLPGQWLELVSILPRPRVVSTFSEVRDWHYRTRKSSDLKLRVATLWRACVAFSEFTPPRLMRLADAYCDALQVDPLAIFSTYEGIQT